MSKILRRPMFRGGGKISSYGTGITSGLADGGRVGFYRGGGTSYDYRPNSSGQILGSDLMNFVNKNPKYGGLEFANTLDKRKSYSPTTYLGSRSGPKITDSSEFLKLFQNYSDPETMLINPDETNLITGKDTTNAKEDNILFEGKTESDYVSPTMTMKQNEMNENLPVKGVELEKKETIVDTSNDSGIEEMADKYFKLMGGEEARGRDISDMLLRFSGAEGNTVQEKFKEFTKEEAKVKSRTEDLKQKATGFAIQQDAQLKMLEKKIDSAESIAEKNILAAQYKQLNSQGQWEKKINTILNDKYSGDPKKRKAASMDALGQPNSLGAALLKYEKDFGVGMKPNQVTFETLASEYYDAAPIDWDGNVNVSGVFYVPGSKVIVQIDKGILTGQKDYSQ